MNPPHNDFDPSDDEHTTTNLIFQFGKFCARRGLAPPTLDEYREMLEQEGFTEPEISAAIEILAANP